MTTRPPQPSVFRPWPGLRAVVSGEGCVAARLAAEMDDLRIARPLIVCGENVAKSTALEIALASIGRPAVVYSGSHPHTPAESVDAGAALARAHRVDGIVSVGGSAAVDCGKGVAVLLASGTDRVAQLAPLSFQNLFERHAAAGTPMALVAITTTLSFAEFLPFWGARDADLRRKRPYPDLGCVERTVFLDGVLAAETPDTTWLETGVKALDDAISTYCRASGPEPFLDPWLERAIAQLIQELPRSKRPGGTSTAATSSADPSVRQNLLTACWMTKQALPALSAPRTTAWLSTAVRHSLGAVCEAGHGAASCVALPEALRFHADATRDRQRQLARALGWSAEGDVPLADGLASLLDALAVPRTLADLGIGSDAIEEVTRAVLEEAPALGGERAVRAAFERMTRD